MPPAPDAAVAADGTATADLWVIEPRQYGVLDRARELWEYRHLLWYFASDALTSMYRRSALGWVWLVMRVAGPIGLSALIFGGVLSVPSEGIPYFLFFLCGTTTWMLFERSLIMVTRSLERNRKVIRKVYFPRLVLPVAFIAPSLFYLGITLVVLTVSVVYYHQRDGIWYVTVHPRLLASVAAVVLSLVFAIAVGLWTSVLQLRYRDIRYGLRYLMPFWFYFTPVIYPLSHIPEKYHWLVAMNPMAPIVETFKWGTLGTGTVNPGGLLTSLSLIVVTMVSGMWFFNREEAASIDKL
jgi:lipopolysaccharide transport system permease protein